MARGAVCLLRSQRVQLPPSNAMTKRASKKAVAGNPDSRITRLARHPDTGALCFVGKDGALLCPKKAGPIPKNQLAIQYCQLAISCDSGIPWTTDQFIGLSGDLEKRRKLLNRQKRTARKHLDALYQTISMYPSVSAEIAGEISSRGIAEGTANEVLTALEFALVPMPPYPKTAHSPNIGGRKRTRALSLALKLWPLLRDKYGYKRKAASRVIAQALKSCGFNSRTTVDKVALVIDQTIRNEDINS